jgi:XTP/dITP diphosphohydrolase
VWFGEVKGSITDRARGTNGYHWDPLFIPDGGDRTFAEMTPVEKLAISPAAVAVRALRRDLGI